MWKTFSPPQQICWKHIHVEFPQGRKSSELGCDNERLLLLIDSAWWECHLKGLLYSKQPPQIRGQRANCFNYCNDYYAQKYETYHSEAICCLHKVISYAMKWRKGQFLIDAGHFVVNKWLEAIYLKFNPTVFKLFNLLEPLFLFNWRPQANVLAGVCFDNVRQWCGCGTQSAVGSAGFDCLKGVTKYRWQKLSLIISDTSAID